MEFEIPLCQFCNHHHYQGIKCEICGHVGKSNLYSKMRTKSAQLHTFNLEFPNNSNFNINNDNIWELSYEIRKEVFCNENNISEYEEFDNLDQQSRHIIGSVGDLPILALRWYMISNYAIIDRCAIISNYRGKGIASKTLEIVIQDIQNVSRDNGVYVEFLKILVPQNSWIEGCLKRHGYQEYRENEELYQIVRGGISHIVLVQKIN